MKFIKAIFSMGTLTFLIVFIAALVLAVEWEPFFNLFAHDEFFLGLWVISIILTISCLYLSTSSWKLGFGRSLVFCAGLGAIASIITVMLEGPAAAIPLLITTVVAFIGSYPLINHVVKPDPKALDNLAAELKHLKGFGDFYRTSLQDWMHAQEGRRVKAVRRMWIGLCFAIPGWAIMTGAIDYAIIPDLPDDESGWWDVVLMVASLILLLAGSGFACMEAWDLKDEMKNKLLDRLSTYFGGLTHYPEMEDFNCKKFKDAGLVRHYNQEDFGDGFTGKHGPIAFALAEVDLTYETGSGKNKITEYIFDGLMIGIAFPLPFKGRTLVLRDKGKIGNWAQDKSGGLQRVNLNIKQFEDKFEVYSTDQIEARAILTPDLMESVIKLGVMFRGKKYDRLKEEDKLAAAIGNIEFAFKDSALMITIATGKDLFEIGHLDASMDDTTRIAQFAREVGLIYEIIDTMELNRKAETFAALKV